MASAMLTVTCAVPVTRADAVRQVVAALAEVQAERPDVEVELALDTLLRARIVVDAGDDEAERTRAFCNDWANRGWRSAAYYHLASHDYPFLYYDDAGRDMDRMTMRLYGSNEPDLDRSKSYPDSIERHSAPRPQAALSVLSFADSLMRRTTPACLDRPTLLRVLSAVFGETATFPTGNLRKTSPSGGARHPTEAYVLPLSVEGLARTWYHFSVAQSELELVSNADDHAVEHWRSTFFGLTRAPFETQAVVLLTSVFERNMYRYREPRTFRTVFMDVGHLCSSLEIVARSEGLRAFVHTGLADLDAERQLGLRGLQEGAMAAVALSALAS